MSAVHIIVPHRARHKRTAHCSDCHAKIKTRTRAHTRKISQEQPCRRCRCCGKAVATAVHVRSWLPSATPKNAKAAGVWGKWSCCLVDDALTPRAAQLTSPTYHKRAQKRSSSEGRMCEMIAISYDGKEWMVRSTRERVVLHDQLWGTSPTVGSTSLITSVFHDIHGERARATVQPATWQRLAR